MCLIVKSDKFEEAANDIVCWKVLEYGSRDGTQPTMWTTPFRYMPVLTATLVACGFTYIDSERRLREGVIHCFANKEDAIFMAKTWENNFVMKAIIPKGTMYICGVDEGNHKISCFGAECIEIVEGLEYIYTQTAPNWHECETLCL